MKVEILISLLKKLLNVNKMQIMKPKIKNLSGKGIIENFYVSELGFLMLRIYMIDDSRWVTHNLGVYNEEDNIFTNLIKK